MTSNMTGKYARNEIFGASAIFGAAFLYGWFGILIRFVGESGIDTFVQITFRSAIASLVLLTIILLTRSKLSFPRGKSLVFYIIRGLFGFASFTLSYFAILNESIALGYLFFYGGFLVGGYLLGHFAFKEKFRVSKLIALIMAVVGVLQIFTAPIIIQKSIIYLFMAFFAGVLSVCWSSFPKILPHHKHSQLESNLFDSVIGFISAMIVGLLLREKFVIPMQFDILWPQLLFVAQTVINGQLMIYGFKHIEAQIGSLIMLLEIVFAVGLAFLIFKEVPSVPTISGCIVIMIASIISVFAEKRPQVMQIPTVKEV